MIVADTGALVALVDVSERNHQRLRRLFADTSSEWVVPWAVLPEVDYLLGAHVGQRAQRAFFNDVASGNFEVEWGHR